MPYAPLGTKKDDQDDNDVDDNDDDDVNDDDNDDEEDRVYNEHQELKET